MHVRFFVLCCFALSPLAAEDWRPLFDGTSFDGWKVPEALGIWSIEDGVIDCQPNADLKGDRNLWTEQSFRDFELRVDWRIKETKGLYNVPIVLPDGSYQLDEDGNRVVDPQPGADSGLYLRGTGKAQVNIWCWPIGSGEVYAVRNNPKTDPEIRAGVTPKVRADRPVGEWNRFHLTMQGDRLTVMLNGQKVLDEATLPGVPETGPIALQHHGGFSEAKQEWSGSSSLVQFRNLWIRPLTHSKKETPQSEG